MIRTIGVDPGSRYTGYGIVEGDGFRLKHIHHGTIKLPANRPLCARLKIIFEQIDASIREYSPQFMAVEEVFRKERKERIEPRAGTRSRNPGRYELRTFRSRV